MARPYLALTCIAFLLAMTASASAATCPANQTFSGTLGPGGATIPVTTTAKGNTFFQFIPNQCTGMDVQTVTMTVNGGSSIAGDCNLVLPYYNANPQTFTVELTPAYFGVDGFAAMPYKLVVSQTKCAA